MCRNVFFHDCEQFVNCHKCTVNVRRLITTTTKSGSKTQRHGKKIETESGEKKLSLEKQQQHTEHFYSWL